MRHEQLVHLPVAIRLTPVRRLGRRALLLFGAYTAVILAVVIAGFLGGAVGIWASVLWGAVLLGGLVLYLRRRSRQPRVDP
jgi:type IV secretory pathway TrbD component